MNETESINNDTPNPAGPVSYKAAVPRPNPEPKENDPMRLSLGFNDAELQEEPTSVLNFPPFGPDKADINKTLSEVAGDTHFDDRIFSVIAEFLVRYEELNPQKSFNSWSFEDFGINDPFGAHRVDTSEVIALWLYPKSKLLKARILFTFTERGCFGKFPLDVFTPEELMRWANLMLHNAVRSVDRWQRAKRLQEKWFILRARVASIKVEPDFKAHHYYCKAREIQALDEMP